MKGKDASELKYKIDLIWHRGPNKKDAFNVISEFINEKYLKKSSIMQQLIEDIGNHGTLDKWKESLK